MCAGAVHLLHFLSGVSTPNQVAETDAAITGARELFARIFVPIDFSQSSHQALGTALELKRAFGSQICLFQLAEEGGADEFLGGLGDPPTPADLVRNATERLHRFVENVAPELADSVEVRARAEVKPIEDLRYEAQRWGATLVVAATTFRGLFRSPAEKLVHGFDIPVLLIPAVEEEPELGLPRKRAPRSTTPGL